MERERVRERERERAVVVVVVAPAPRAPVIKDYTYAALSNGREIGEEEPGEPQGWGTVRSHFFLHGVIYWIRVDG